MVTFRNNNNNKETVLEEMIGILKLTEIDQNMVLISQTTTTFKEKSLEEIIIMLQN